MNKSQKRKLDKLWSEVVKKLAGNKCEVCGRTRSLNSHHLFSRRFMSTRYEVENGICTCVRCHFWFHQKPLPAAEWIISRRGQDWYNRLELKAKTLAKPDYEAVERVLKEYLKGGGR